MRNNMEKWQSTKYIWVNIYQSCGNQKSLQKWMGLGSTRGWPHSLIHLSDTYVLNTYRYHALPSLPGIQQWAKKYPDFMKCMQISKDGYQTTAFDDINYPVWGAQGFLSSLAFYSDRDHGLHIFEMKTFIQLVANSIALFITTYTEKHWIFYLIPGCFSIL